MDETTPPPSPAPAATPAPEPATAPAGANAEGTPPARPVKVKKEETWWDTLRFLLWLFLAAVVLRTFLFAPFSIPSGSMMPNLLIGDYLFVSKWSYGYSRYSLPFHPINFEGRVFSGTPERGDVVVFRHPTTGEDWVKRVIGLPGDRISVSGGVVTLNGQPIPREQIAPFDQAVSPNSDCRDRAGQVHGNVRLENGADGQLHCLYPRYRETLPGGRTYEVLDQGNSAGDDFPETTVPAGHLFMMGDNRDDSMDSRFPNVVPAGSGQVPGVGFLPIDNVLGRATIGFWSTDGSANWILPWTWFTAARWSRIGMTW